LTILIIGLGSIANKHINAIKKLYPNCKIYALRSQEKKISKIEGVINIINFEEIEEKVYCVLITNPTSLHSEAINKCLNLNVPLLIEKPIFDKVIENIKLVDYINSRNIITYIACNMRFHPAIIFLKKYLEENIYEINEVNIYCGSFLPDWRKDDDYKKSYSANPELGGGVHLDLIHEIDYIFWLFGKPINVNSIKRNVSTLKILAFDFASYTLEYPKFCANLILNYYRNPAKRNIELVLSNEILDIDLIKCTVKNSNNKIIFSKKDYNILDTYNKQIEYYFNCIDNSILPMNNINESFEILKIALHEEVRK
jgi:predicted dehydrogenase